MRTYSYFWLLSSIQYYNITDKRCVAAKHVLRELGVFLNAIICIFTAPWQAANYIQLNQFALASHSLNNYVSFSRMPVLKVICLICLHHDNTKHYIVRIQLFQIIHLRSFFLKHCFWHTASLASLLLVWKSFCEGNTTFLAIQQSEL